MAIASLSLLLGSAIGLVFPLIIQDLINTVLAKGSQLQLSQITLLLIAIFLVRAVFYYIQTYSLSFVGERIVLDLRSQTYSHLQTLSIRFFNDRRVGELISRLSSDVTIVRTALTNNIATVISQSLTFTGSLVLMLVLNWRLTLFILALAPLVISSAVIFGARLRKLSTLIQDQLADSTAIAEEALSNIRIVKSFTRESFEVQRYDENINRTFLTTMKATTWRAIFGSLVTFLGFASIALILWFGGLEVLANRLTTGSLVAFLVYGINIAASMGSFTSLYTQLQEAAGASQRIFELIHTHPEIVDIPNAVQLPQIQGQITLKDVSFAYPGAQHVLHQINLVIDSGEVVALVGPSGAGKSTLFNLIPRFYDPTSGQIFVDGKDLREVTLTSLRGQIGLVPQETQLFSGSIRENLRYGNLEASEADIQAAAQAANAEEFILRLAEGYDTLVGERGVKLSGGQRQRIAIARAILRNPRILLLDEATSSLDSESEGLVQEALNRLMVGRTTVIIAHRLSTVHKANRIAVLDAGRLVELGNHAELMAINGLYARLYQMQFRNGLSETSSSSN
ncbi:MAG: ABC transporter transmembrane domain-containing protein [Anaerolineales bacterium]|jgi:subfamily B ATP-binding cassette protein MsbA|nr:ABC transporter transmembrane domain-containing protein [Anaerolineales bacterium]